MTKKPEIRIKKAKKDIKEILEGTPLDIVNEYEDYVLETGLWELVELREKGPAEGSRRIGSANMLYANSTILERVVEVLDRDMLSIEDFSELARHDPWRGIWNIGKDGCMGIAAADFTEDQKTLTTFAKMYDNAYILHAF